MKKILSILALLIISLDLYAAMAIAVPERDNERFALIDGRDMLILDDYVWYKRWHGLLAEQLDDGIYMISDGNHAVIAAERSVSTWELEDTISLYDADSLILLGSGIPDVEVLKDSGITTLLLLNRPTELEKRMLKEEGISAITVKPGDVLDFENGQPVDDNKGTPVSVICPMCGTRFAIYI